MITDDYSKELYHYGVKGMKWGVRRAIKKRVKGEIESATNAALTEHKNNKYYRKIRNISSKKPTDKRNERIKNLTNKILENKKFISKTVSTLSKDTVTVGKYKAEQIINNRAFRISLIPFAGRAIASDVYRYNSNVVKGEYKNAKTRLKKTEY